MNLFILFIYLVTFGCGWLNVEIMLNFAPFSATHHTGNLTRIAISLFKGDIALMVSLVCVVLVFIAGAALSGLINTKENNHFSSWFGTSNIIAAVLLIILSYFFETKMVMVYYCSLFAGFQNGIISQFASRASHMSGIATDSGIGLGRFIRDILNGTYGNRKKHFYVFIVKFISIIVFVAGAILGAGLAPHVTMFCSYLILGLFNIEMSVFYLIMHKKWQAEEAYYTPNTHH